MDASQTFLEVEPQHCGFGPVHIVEPTSEHTHTIILLHGRGSTGLEFAEELEESTLTEGKALFAKSSGCRFVLPSSKDLYSTMFDEDIPAWFEAHSLTDITARQDLQVQGIRESVAYVIEIIDGELTRLGGDASKLILGGISMGGAIALWTLLNLRDSLRRPGIVMVSNTWLPFAGNIERVLEARQNPDASQKEPFDMFVDGMLFPELVPDESGVADRAAGKISICHGVDDGVVEVSLGRQAAGVLSQIGFEVEWKEYAGAEPEGHWYKVPEQMDDMYDFIAGGTKQD